VLSWRTETLPHDIAKSTNTAKQDVRSVEIFYVKKILNGTSS
jgi:hypothetical protein